MKPCTIPKIQKTHSRQWERIESTHMFADRIADEILPALFTLKDIEIPLNDPKSPISDIISPEEWISKIMGLHENMKIQNPFQRPWIDADSLSIRTTPQKNIVPDFIIVFGKIVEVLQMHICFYLETQEKSVIESCFADLQTLARDKAHPILIVRDKAYRQELFGKIKEQYLKGFWILTVESFKAIFKILLYENSTKLRDAILHLPILLKKWQISLLDSTANEIIEWTGLKPIERPPSPPSLEEYAQSYKNLLKTVSIPISRFISSLSETRRYIENTKLGIIGMGDRGIQILSKYIAETKQMGVDAMFVAAICDQNSQAIEKAITQAGINDLPLEKCPKIYTNLEEFLRDPNFHMVIITLPAPLDQKVVDQVIERRKIPMIVSKDNIASWEDPWIH